MKRAIWERLLLWSSLVGLMGTSCGKRFDSTTGNLLEPKFSAIRDQILVPSCVSCHRAFETYAGVRRKVSLTSGDDDDILGQVSSGEMPPAGPRLSTAEISTITAWIARGAPND